MKIVFLGTPDIAVPSLEFFINKEDIEVLRVVTQPDRPAGRGMKLQPSPVKKLAESHNIKVYQPKLIRKDEELIGTLKELKPDAFIMVAFGQILSKEILDIPGIGTINLHSSLLPKYRGPNPIQWAIINGEKVTGITTMLSDVGVDTGPMLLRKEIEITKNMNAIELSQKIAYEGPIMLYDSLIGLDNKSLIPVPQPEEGVSYAPKLTKEDGKIDWSKSSLAIHNQVCGMKPFPSTYTFFKDDMIKIIKTELTDNEIIPDFNGNGQIIDIIKNGFRVATGDGEIIVRELQPTCKKPVCAGSRCNGARIQPGDRFDNGGKNVFL